MRKPANRTVAFLAILALALLAAADAQPTNQIFTDGFESGDTSAWGHVRGDLDVNESAAMEGLFGLEVPGGSRSSLVTREPDRETTVLVSFFFDPNNIEIGPRRGVEILRFSAQGRRHHLRLVLRQDAAGEHRLALMVRGNRGRYDRIGGGIVTPGQANLVEVAWEAATRRNGNDGSAALFLNGEMEAHEPTISNGRLDVRAIQIGLRGRNVRASRGSYYLDDFQSFRTLAP